MLSFSRKPLAASGLAVLLVACALAPARVDRADNGQRPALLILVVFDQLRGDYLTRWHALFPPGGFRRLEQAGSYFPDCHYDYALTVTAAGHATLLTGCNPCEHGMIGNEWLDRPLGKVVHSVEDEAYRLVDSLGREQSGKGVSPARMLRPTLGDMMRAKWGSQTRIVSLSLKDRSAVLMAGKQADVCYWFDVRSGRFITSSFYRDAQRSWIDGFDSARLPARLSGLSWASAGLGRQDILGDSAEQRLLQLAFCHPLGAEPGKALNEAATLSPYGNDLLFQLVCRAIEEERLGHHDAPDLLCVSFSANDLVGHRWGPDSPEVLDITLRSDRMLKQLLEFLDRKVGPGRYLFALSSDHGVCPLPERMRAIGREAGRIATDVLMQKAEAYLVQRFPQGRVGRWFSGIAFPWIYMNNQKIAEAGLDPDEIAKVLSGWLEQQVGIQNAFTRAELSKAAANVGGVVGRVRRSFLAKRSGDIYVLQKPYYLFGSGFDSPTGTTHGTHYDYDTHVPLMFMGCGIGCAVRTERVSPLIVTSVFARAIGVSAPADDEASSMEAIQLKH
jgi:predicted AlkP superfamily pyrophosphatase or phosphodiesterase